MLRIGRFGRPMDPAASEFISSMQADVRLFKPVVQINMAHALMLAERRVISKSDVKAILRALRDLYDRGVKALDMRPELEDIHMAIEEFVIAAAGEEVGGKLHTAKSRNDQVATAIRMTLRREILEVQTTLIKLINSLTALAAKHTKTIMPGYTHLQVAQPTTFAHYLMAYAWAFARDLNRLMQAYDQTNWCAMGACALAGTSFPIDPARVARLLGFERVMDNAMDAVGSRDFAVQTISALAILMTNLSRLAEELVLWSSAEFDMIAIPDKFAATSSIMPQKKNPVVAEIARAKVGRLTGDLSGTLATLRALPQSYSLDLQELTPLVWDAVDQTKSSVGMMSKLIGTIQPKADVMRTRAEDSFAAATELADTLVREAGPSFRAAHTVVGKMIARAIKEGKTPSALTLDNLQAACRAVLRREIPLSEQKFKAAWDLGKCVGVRKSLGGPAPASVKRQITQLQKLVRKRENLVRVRAKVIKKAEGKLLREARRRSI